MSDLANRQHIAENKLKSLSSENKIFWNEDNSTPKFAKGELSNKSSESPQTIATNFLKENHDLLELDENLTQKLEVELVDTDKWGFSHVFFQQFLNEIKVYQGSTQVHINKEGIVFAYKDYRVTRVKSNFRC